MTRVARVPVIKTTVICQDCCVWKKQQNKIHSLVLSGCEWWIWWKLHLWKSIYLVSQVWSYETRCDGSQCHREWLKPLCDECICKPVWSLYPIFLKMSFPFDTQLSVGHILICICQHIKFWVSLAAQSITHVLATNDVHMPGYQMSMIIFERFLCNNVLLLDHMNCGHYHYNHQHMNSSIGPNVKKDEWTIYPIIRLPLCMPVHPLLPSVSARPLPLYLLCSCIQSHDPSLLSGYINNIKYI